MAAALSVECMVSSQGDSLAPTLLKLLLLRTGWACITIEQTEGVISTMISTIVALSLCGNT